MSLKKRAGVIGGEASSAVSGTAAGLPAASTFSPSGAPHQTTEIDAEHPAVDNNPRANTTLDQNKIDFNDPSLSGAEAVAKNLADRD